MASQLSNHYGDPQGMQSHELSVNARLQSAEDRVKNVTFWWMASLSGEDPPLIRAATSEIDAAVADLRWLRENLKPPITSRGEVS